jgi:hypothetical protein
MWGDKLYKIFVRKPEGKRLLIRPTHGWGNNIKMDLWETVGSCGPVAFG